MNTHSLRELNLQILVTYLYARYISLIVDNFWIWGAQRTDLCQRSVNTCIVPYQWTPHAHIHVQWYRQGDYTGNVESDVIRSFDNYSNIHGARFNLFSFRLQWSELFEARRHLTGKTLLLKSFVHLVHCRNVTVLLFKWENNLYSSTVLHWQYCNWQTKWHQIWFYSVSIFFFH